MDMQVIIAAIVVFLLVTSVSSFLIWLRYKQSQRGKRGAGGTRPARDSEVEKEVVEEEEEVEAEEVEVEEVEESEEAVEEAMSIEVRKMAEENDASVLALEQSKGERVECGVGVDTTRSMCEALGCVWSQPISQSRYSMVERGRECKNAISVVVEGNEGEDEVKRCALSAAKDERCGTYFEFHSKKKSCRCVPAESVCERRKDGDVDRFKLIQVVPPLNVPLCHTKESSLAVASEVRRSIREVWYSGASYNERSLTCKLWVREMKKEDVGLLDTMKQVALQAPTVCGPLAYPTCGYVWGSVTSHLPFISSSSEIKEKVKGLAERLKVGPGGPTEARINAPNGKMLVTDSNWSCGNLVYALMTEKWGNMSFEAATAKVAETYPDCGPCKILKKETELLPGQELRLGDVGVHSPNGMYVFVIVKHGRVNAARLVETVTKKTLFSLPVEEEDGFVRFQKNGELVYRVGKVGDTSSNILWRSGTSGGASLVLTNTGEVVIFSYRTHEKNILWSQPDRAKYQPGTPCTREKAWQCTTGKVAYFSRDSGSGYTGRRCTFTHRTKRNKGRGVSFAKDLPSGQPCRYWWQCTSCRCNKNMCDTRKGQGWPNLRYRGCGCLSGAAAKWNNKAGIVESGERCEGNLKNYNFACGYKGQMCCPTQARLRRKNEWWCKNIASGGPCRYADQCLSGECHQDIDKPGGGNRKCV